MKIAHLVNTFAFVNLLVASVSVSVAIWAASQSDAHNYRISLAHTSYEHHLQLTADTYLLFKRFGDLLLAGEADRASDVDSISKRLNANLGKIRATIEEEIRVVGEEEIEELELLDELEEVIHKLSSLVEQTLKREDINDVRSNWRDLSLILNDNIKDDFRTIITIALEEEQEEVEETEAEASAQMALVRQISYGLAVVFLLVNFFMLAIFRREFSKPFVKLLGGVRDFAAGNFSNLIELKGRSELSEIATVLDEMSQVVSARTKDLTMQNEELEQAVRQRTDALERLLAEARKSEKNRRMLLADVSHELRTPLTVIQGESDIALRGSEKSVEEYKEALERTRMAANHTANLINDLLFISRKESGSLHLSLTSVDISQLIKETINLSGMDVDFTSTDEEIIVRVDDKRIRQSILALLENAKHHGGGEIEVVLETYSNAVHVKVSDNGPGISDSDKEHAFERFFRGSNAGSRYREGLGLGLPIVCSIAEAHGGTTKILDREPNGVTVVMSLPRNSGD